MTPIVRLQRGALLSRALVVIIASNVLWAPLAAEAQQAGRVYKLAILNQGAAPAPNAPNPVLATLRDRGFITGQNLVIDAVHADWHPERLSDLVAALVQRKPDAILVYVCGAPLDAARRATPTIPIVVATCNDDLVSSAVIRSLAHPGGNITGLSKLTPELGVKRLELLKEMLPKASQVAVVWNPDYSDFAADWRELRAAAKALGVTLQPIEFRRADDFDDAFSRMAKQRPDAFIMFSDIVSWGFRTRLVAAAAKSRVPGMYAFREIPDAGGLMSYGPNIVEMLRAAGGYIAQIFNGARPGDLPVQQATKFELVINLKTAKALGVTIPPSILLRADQVIE